MHTGHESTTSGFKQKHLLDLHDITAENIITVLDTAVSFKNIFTRSIKKVPSLRGKTVCNLFFEPSTRTRISFELAAKRLSADVINFNAQTSSLSKGESLIDTAKTLLAMNADIIIMRHSSPGAAHFLAHRLPVHIVNAGDGSHAHPTQALLDIFTIREKLGYIEGLNILIVGDILHSRVARSNIQGLRKLGAHVSVCGPSTLIPAHIEQLGVTVFYDLDQALEQCDVINVLRIQLERQQQGLFPSLREYSLLFGLTAERLERAQKGNKKILVLHPGPMNRGIEISSEVADSAQSVITEQVTNGIAVRMAVLYLLCGQGTVPDTVE